MSLTPLLNASFAIQLHAFLALLALGLTLSIFVLPRGTPNHKLLGRIWVLAMAVVAISSFWISTLRLIGPFSPIHLLSVFTLWQLWVAVRAARQGRIAQHQRAMKSLVFWALLLAGSFTLLPGRIMFAVLTGS